MTLAMSTRRGARRVSSRVLQSSSQLDNANEGDGYTRLSRVLELKDAFETTCCWLNNIFTSENPASDVLRFAEDTAKLSTRHCSLTVTAKPNSPTSASKSSCHGSNQVHHSPDSRAGVLFGVQISPSSVECFRFERTRSTPRDLLAYESCHTRRFMLHAAPTLTGLMVLNLGHTTISKHKWYFSTNSYHTRQIYHFVNN